MRHTCRRAIAALVALSLLLICTRAGFCAPPLFDPGAPDNSTPASTPRVASTATTEPTSEPSTRPAQAQTLSTTAPTTSPTALTQLDDRFATRIAAIRKACTQSISEASHNRIAELTDLQHSAMQSQNLDLAVAARKEISESEADTGDQRQLNQQHRHSSRSPR